jgi:hypothetical protein
VEITLMSEETGSGSLEQAAIPAPTILTPKIRAATLANFIIPENPPYQYLNTVI